MPKIKKEMQELFGYTDTQVESLEENQIRFIEKLEEMGKYNLVAKIVESRNCCWGAKVGDKIVLSGAGGCIEFKECTNKDRVCLWALAPLQPFAQVFQDRIAAGINPEESIFKRIHCLDSGVENCGWGQITMEIRAEKIDKAPWD